MTHTKTLERLRFEWSWRLKQLGITKHEFCKMADVCYPAMWTNSNPTLMTLDKTEKALAEIEATQERK